MPKITKLDIKNFLGIEELSLEPGKVNIIRGKNAAGKTSIIKAIQAATGGGHDGVLIRKGAKYAQVGIEFDNELSITKTINSDKSTLSVRDHGKKVVTKPQAMLDKIFSMVNPLDLLTAPAKYKTELLLEAMPLKITQEQLDPIIGNINFVVQYNLESHGLELLTKVRKQIFDERTVTNRLLDTKKKAIENTSVFMLQTEETPETITTKIEQLETEKQDLVDKKEKYLADLAIQKQAEIDAIHEKYNSQLQATQERFDLRMNPIISELATSKEQQIQIVGKIEQTKQLEKDKEELAIFMNDSQCLTNAIESLDKLKTALQKSLPIPGLEVIDDNIFFNGVHFDTLNTAEQMKLCIEISRLHNNSGLMIVDGIERMDSANQELLFEMAEKNNIQLMVTEVSEIDELMIDSK